MINFTFALNNQPISILKTGAQSFPAFSGRGNHVNKRTSMYIAGFGAIPIGTYYILDRQSGGLIGSLRDMFKSHADWFALYAVDGKIDDETYCNQVKRGNFRIHAKGRLGISNGCITIEKQADFNRLRAILKATQPQAILGSALLAYGKVVVK